MQNVKVELKTNSDIYRLEETINSFIDGKDVVDIKYTMSQSEHSIMYSACIIYKTASDTLTLNS